MCRSLLLVLLLLLQLRLEPAGTLVEMKPRMRRSDTPALLAWCRSGTIVAEADMSVHVEETTAAAGARQLELARAEFLHRLRELPGVLGTVVPESNSEYSVRVYVASRKDASGRAVRELEDTILEKYPESGFYVWLSESAPPAGDT
jgi:hypothetical protein